MGNEQRRKVDNCLRQLLIHLLLWQYWVAEGDRTNWHNYFCDRLDRIYPKARRAASLKTELAIATFPEQGSYSREQLLDPEFYPTASQNPKE